MENVVMPRDVPYIKNFRAVPRTNARIFRSARLDGTSNASLSASAAGIEEFFLSHVTLVIDLRAPSEYNIRKTLNYGPKELLKKNHSDS